MVVVCAALLLCLDASAAPPAASWTTYGNGPTRTGDGAATPTTLSRDFVLPLDGRIVGQVLAANGTFYAPRVLIVKGTSVQTVMLPTARGRLLAQSSPPPGRS
jgi:hypothetical protein